MLAVLLGYALPAIYSIFANPNFELTQICNFKSNWQNENLDTLDTSDYNLALEMTEKSADGTDGTSLTRVQFYMAVRAKGDDSVTLKWVNTTTCASLFEKLMIEAKFNENAAIAVKIFLEHELIKGGNKGPWLCPDIRTFELNKDAY